jgi:hypothetical protein
MKQGSCAQDGDMSKEKETNAKNSSPKGLGQFLPGGELGPIAERQEYEQRISGLPPDQREFAEESARFADLWQYFSEHRMQLPQAIIDQLAELSKLTAAQQTAVLRGVNRDLMKYLTEVSEDSGIRQ